MWRRKATRSTRLFLNNFSFSLIFINSPLLLSTMKLKVFYDRENKDETVEFDKAITVKGLLKKMNINPVTVIVSKNSSIITEDEKLDDNDDIKIISVISGG